jgi:hypothetical protein
MLNARLNNRNKHVFANTGPDCMKDSVSCKRVPANISSIQHDISSALQRIRRSSRQLKPFLDHNLKLPDYKAEHLSQRISGRLWQGIYQQAFPLANLSSNVPFCAGQSTFKANIKWHGYIWWRALTASPVPTRKQLMQRFVLFKTVEMKSLKAYILRF